MKRTAVEGRRALAIATCLALAGCGLFGKDKPPAGPDGGQGEACLLTSQCAGGFVCAAGFCALEGSVGTGGHCSASRDCSTGLFCTEVGVCGPAGSGAVGDSCSTGADCSKGLACQLSGFEGVCTSAGTGDLGAVCTGTTDCIAGLVCGSNKMCDPIVDAYPPFAGVICAPDEQPFRAYFQVPRTGMRLPDFYRLPFPNDIRVKADGTLNMSDFPRPGPSILGVDIVDLYATAWSEDFAGFGSIAPVTFRFSSELDFNTLGTNGANLHYVDITDPASPNFGADRGRNYGYDTGKGKFLCQQSLVVGNNPNDPLEPNHTYGIYFTTDVKSKAGAAPAIDPDLTAVLSDTQPTDPDLARAWTQYAKFRAYLAAKSIPASSVAGLSVITTGDPTAPAKALADATLAGPLPQLTDLTLCDGTNVSPCAGEGDRACGDSTGSFYEIHGKFTEPNYQNGTPPYATVADGGAIAYTAGVPTPNGALSICFALTIPKTVMPAGGWPLVITAHGTGGSFKAAISDGIAGGLASASVPMATLTFDGIEHGARKAGSARSSESLVFNVINPRAARDNHLQGFVDVVQAMRIAQVAPFTVPTVGNIKFDASKDYFFGHSQGSNVGIPGIAMSPDAKAAIFSGAGSNLTDGILNKKSPVNAKAGLELLLGDSLGGGHPVMVIWQSFFDRVDPVNFDKLVVAKPPAGRPSKHVFMSWSATDTYAPKATLTVTAQVMNLALASPTVIESIAATDTRPINANRTGGDAQQRLAAVFQYASDGTYDGHFVAQKNPAAIADWTAFLTSIANGTPAVP
jgi:hypothetical protein